MGMVFVGKLVHSDDFNTVYHILLKAVTIKRTRRLVSTVTRRF